MNPSTAAYIELTKADEALHADAIATIRASVGSVAKVALQATAKGEAIFAVQCDETDPGVRGLIYEGQDKQKVVRSLVGDWQEKSVALIRALAEVSDYDTRFAAAVVAIPTVLPDSGAAAAR